MTATATHEVAAAVGRRRRSSPTPQALNEALREEMRATTACS